MKTRCFACAVLVVGLAQTPVWAQARGPVNNDFLVALDRAQELVPGGQVVLGRPENKAGRPLYGFYIWVNGQLREVELGGRGSTVEKNEEISTDKFSQAVLDALRARKGAKIPFSRFLELAGERVKDGQLSRLELASEKGKLHILADLTTDNKTVRVDIDLAEGKVVGVTEVRSSK